MNPHRKKKISDLADFMSWGFSRGGVTDLAGIADDESLPIHLDHYEDCFDGMLFHDGWDYHIHLNMDRGNTLTSKRGRFTLAHELGHYFIEEHRIGLKYGLLTPHPSFNDYGHVERIELEADYFAGCLLMPYNGYRTFCAKKPFSIDLLHEVSEHFQVSVMACLLRFIEAGTREILVVVSQDKTVKRFSKSTDFPGFPFRFKLGGRLPLNTLAETYSTNLRNLSNSEIELSDPQAWFHVNDGRSYNTMYEQCYYAKTSRQVVTLIWFE
ncbi:ImmA/IrrE family metallo-endopeptidase [Salmonirosea aquatica]|uniref:ImmA/IrrE family metallo-endopeptidase n=1 Tax=Salmonirosea aquatica TaxID=2654236 RepID=A0A7C9FQP5_9BACT|nr:ImmA/IrrE family metallo-endopeptidase [Cytophagaceae bacterium SJW1-29]